MNDDFADTLIAPAIQRVSELQQQPGSFDGAVVFGDGGTTPVRLQLDDYWAEGLTEKAEHYVADFFKEQGITRWVLATPASYRVQDDGPFQMAHVDVLEPKFIWALCYEENVGYDLCALFYVQRPNGDFSYDEDITMLSGEQQMLDEAIGFTLMRDMLEA